MFQVGSFAVDLDNDLYRLDQEDRDEEGRRIKQHGRRTGGEGEEKGAEECAEDDG